jgi:hypothetical protein
MAQTAACMTGQLNIVRKLQTRSLRDLHPDQRWVNAMTRSYLEWLIELSTIYRIEDLPASSVAFVGKDDKAKKPVGDRVAVSMTVQFNNKAIVPLEPSGRNSVAAADHDWKYANIVPSVVTLHSNTLNDMTGSFFCGDAENGTGEIEVTLRDAVFEGATVFGHIAQIKKYFEDRLTRDGVLVLDVFVLQTDGGPDHNTTFLRTQLAFIVLCLLVIGHQPWVVIQGVPHGSYLNKIKHAMSILNIALMHVALQHALMPDWAKEHVKSALSMNDIRDTATDLNEEKKEARKQLEAEDSVPSRNVAGMIGTTLEASIASLTLMLTNPAMESNAATVMPPQPIVVQNESMAATVMRRVKRCWEWI